MNNPTLRLSANVLVSTDQMMQLASTMLNAAEAARRRGDNTFNASPLPGAAVTADWSLAAGLIDRAKHHLDESLPNGQLERTQAALGALVLGVELLIGAMGDRGVSPLRLTFGGPQPAPQQPSPILAANAEPFQ